VRRPSLPREVVEFGAQSLRRFVEVEGTQQATILSAQAFTSLIPFLVVSAAAGPGDEDLADRIIERFDLEGASARSVEALFNDAGEVESAVTWVGIIILVLSALSFTRALQKVFQRAYRLESEGWRDAWRGLAWLGTFTLWVVVSSPLRETLSGIAGVVFAIMVSVAMGFLVWLWTPVILLGSVEWQRLVPGAVVCAVLGALLGAASAIYVPVLLTWSAERYGLIGIAFTLQSWLLTAAFVIVIGAVVGAVASEHMRVRP
jgi:membrane protein